MHDENLWLEIAWLCLLISLMAIGGANAMVPEIHRYVIEQRGWMRGDEFAALFAIAQASPGPNVLFVAVLGWNVGLNAGGGPSAGWVAWVLALFGVLVTMVAILLPSSVLTYTATRWAHRNRDMRGIKAFKAGMAPIVVALLVCTGWLLTAAHKAMHLQDGRQCHGAPQLHIRVQQAVLVIPSHTTVHRSVLEQVIQLYRCLAPWRTASLIKITVFKAGGHLPMRC